MTVTDIVKRLRENILADAFVAVLRGKDKVISSGKLTERLIYERHDAADEIEKLMAANDVLEDRLTDARLETVRQTARIDDLEAAVGLSAAGQA